MTSELIERLLSQIREDTLCDDDPILHRPIVDQDGNAVGSEQIALSKVLTAEAFVDENGTAWTAPTGYAYAMVCKVRDKQATALEQLQAEVERLREGLAEIASSARGGDPLARDSDARTLEAIARHADRALLQPKEQQEKER